MFEYVAVLTSIVIGLGITHLLQGVARVIQHPGRERLYWVLVVYGAFTASERYHQVMAVALLAYQLSWALRLFETVT